MLHSIHSGHCVLIKEGERVGRIRNSACFNWLIAHVHLIHTSVPSTIKLTTRESITYY